MVRSPSRDSVTTQVSLGSVMESTKPSNLRVSFRAKSECPLSRGPSPLPCHRLAVPTQRTRPCSANCDEKVKDIWLDEGNDLIRSCGALSKVLGLQRSFSCGDILTISDSVPIRHTRSDTFLMECEDYTWGRLDANSRSLSTWVAVGDVEESTSQLPSPHVELNKGFPGGDHNTHFTPADLIRSVNKKVRQNYIRRRLKVTYKALEQFSESEFDLDRLEAAVKKTRQSQNLDSLVLNTAETSRTPSSLGNPVTTCPVAQVIESAAREKGGKDSKLKRVGIVSTKEIARDRGKPLSKYERNTMIFDWLHTLDETATASHEHEHEHVADSQEQITVKKEGQK